MKKNVSCVLLVFFVFILGSGFSYADYLNQRWNYTAKDLVKYVYAGDVDGDGFKDVVAASSYETLTRQGSGWVYMFDREGNVKWRYDVEGPIAAMKVDDLNNDNVKEIIVGWFSRLDVIDSSSGYRKSSISLEDYGKGTFGVVDLNVEDIDLDRSKEIVCILKSNDGGRVSVYNNQGRLRWKKDLKEKPEVMQVYDINNDGLEEIILGSVTGGIWNKPSRLRVFEPNKGEELWSFETAKGVSSIYVADLEGDGSLEIIVGCYEGFIYVLNNRGEQISNITFSGHVEVIEAADLDRDGRREVFIGSGDVYALDYKLNRMWKAGINNNILGIDFLDVDGDGILEVLALSDKLYIIDKNGNLAWKYDENTKAVLSIYTEDLYDDGSTELVIGTFDKHVYVLESRTQAKMVNATKHLSSARRMLQVYNFKDARKNLEAAKNIYKSLGRRDKVDECDRLYEEINNAEYEYNEKKKVADEACEKAYKAYVDEIFQDALGYARKAVTNYPTTEVEGISRCQSIIKNASTVLGSKADSSLEKASTLFEQKNYAEAYRHAVEANETYKLINNYEGLKRSSELISMITAESNDSELLGAVVRTGDRQREGNNNTTFITAGLMMLALILFSAWAIGKVLKKPQGKPSTKIRHKTDDLDYSGYVVNNILEDVDIGREKHRQTTEKMREQHHRTHENRKHERPEEKKTVDVVHTTQNLQSQVIEKKTTRVKELPKISKDSYRGYGVSLRNLADKKS